MTAYKLPQAPARPYPVTATGLVVAGACFLKGVSIRNTDAANAAGVQVSDGDPSVSGLFVAALQAGAGLAPAPCWFSEGGILLERGAFATVFGTGTFLAAVWAVPAERSVNVDDQYLPDLYAQHTS